MVSAAERFPDRAMTVTVIVRTADGHDDYGNATFSESEVEVPDCLVAALWRKSSVDDSSATRTVDESTLYNMSGTWPNDSVNNRVRLADGTLWELKATPEHWPGAIGGVVVQLRKVSG